MPIRHPNTVHTGRTVEAHASGESFTVKQEVWTSRSNGSKFGKVATRDGLGRFHGATNFRGTRS